MRHLPAISIYGYVSVRQNYALWAFMGVGVGVANYYFGQSIGIDETNTFQLKMEPKSEVTILYL